jgi:transcriptional regulator with XRE-family HTH domain
MADRASKLERTGAATRQIIGERLRLLRLERGLSLREAAERAGLSRSFVGMVESGTTEIAVSRLIRLADAYGVLITELLVDVQDVEVEFVTAEGTFEFPTGMEGVALRYLSSPSWGMQPFRVTLEPGSGLRSLRHPGEEFVHCVEGTPVMVIEARELPMSPGDTVFIPDHADHSYLNESNEQAVLVGATLRVRRESLPGSMRKRRRTRSAPDLNAPARLVDVHRIGSDNRVQ